MLTPTESKEIDINIVMAAPLVPAQPREMLGQRH